MKNRYYEFDVPVRWFRAIGSSPSNTWIGASRAFDTVHEPADLEPGDRVHALVGGVFVVRKDGSVEAGRFTMPKHIFEKSYGPRRDDSHRLADMAACGRCREIPEPAGRVDYASAKAQRDTPLGDLKGSLAAGKHPLSPFLRRLVDAAQDACLPGASEESGARWQAADVGREPETTACSLVLTHEGSGSRMEIKADPCSPTVWVIDRGFGFSDALRAGPHHGLTPEYRNDAMTIFPEGETAALMAYVSDFLPDACKASTAPGATA